jgi:hypothetical protein
MYGKGSRFWFEIELPEILGDEKNNIQQDLNDTISLEETEVIPPLEIIESLYNYADGGDIKSLKIKLDNIRNSGEKYENFCNKLNILLDNFEIDRLTELLKHYKV